jgi:hypothetical protein
MLVLSRQGLHLKSLGSFQTVGVCVCVWGGDGIPVRKISLDQYVSEGSIVGAK